MSREELRAALPDEPQWVETRALLACSECPLYVDHASGSRSFVVVDSGLGHLASVVGRPDPVLVASAVADSDEVLAFPDNVDFVMEALPSYIAERAYLHTLPSVDIQGGRPVRPTRYVEPAEVEGLGHVDAQLMAELREAVEDESRIVAALDGSLPVAFCYAGSFSETLWDVAIDTVPSHRRRGFAASAAQRLICDLGRQGLAPVWGAVASNDASLGLARKLGFTPVDEIWVVSPSDDTAARPSA